VEVKCPYTFRNVKISDVLKDGKLDYINSDGNNYFVKKGHSRGYYEQILLQQALSGVYNAELLIWTKHGSVVIPVDFDELYWNSKILPRLKEFFLNYVAVEILTSRLKNGQTSYSDTGAGMKIDVDLIDNNQISSVETGSNTVSVSSANDKSTGKNNDSDDDAKLDCDDDWTLGCKSYCKDSRAPTFSKVKGQIIACDCHLVCAPGTWFHLYCEGFRRVPQQLEGRLYVCTKCRDVHPDKENLYTSNGFY
jgi:hypothetical protein